MDGKSPRRLSTDEAKEQLRRKSNLRPAIPAPSTDRPSGARTATDAEETARAAQRRSPQGGRAGSSAGELATTGMALVQLAVTEARRRPLQTATVVVVAGVALGVSKPLRRTALSLLSRAISRAR